MSCQTKSKTCEKSSKGGIIPINLRTRNGCLDSVVYWSRNKRAMGCQYQRACSDVYRFVFNRNPHSRSLWEKKLGTLFAEDYFDSEGEFSAVPSGISRLWNRNGPSMSRSRISIGPGWNRKIESVAISCPEYPQRLGEGRNYWSHGYAEVMAHSAVTNVMYCSALEPGGKALLNFLCAVSFKRFQCFGGVSAESPEHE